MRSITMASLLGLVLVGGCGSLGGGSSNDWEPTPQPAPGTSVYGNVPSGASRIAQGYGTVRYRAEEAGRVWIGNDTRQQVVTDTQVRRGDEVLVEPGADRVSVNGQIIFQRNMEKNNEHSVFFAPGRTSDTGGGSGAGAGVYGGIPERAQRLAGGTGRVRVKAPAPGKVWIGNDTKRFEVTTVNVEAGDTVEVDASKDRVTVNGKVVFAENLESKHEHAVFFQEGAGGGGTAGYGKIPADATRVATGTVNVQYRAETDGNVWIGDDVARIEVMLYPVKRGDLVEIDIRGDRIMVNGKVVRSDNLESKHAYSVYFRAGALKDAGPGDVKTPAGRN